MVHVFGHVTCPNRRHRAAIPRRPRRPSRRRRRRACRSNRPPILVAKHVRILVEVQVRLGCAFVRAASAPDEAWLRWHIAWTCFRANAPLPGPPEADSAHTATPWTCRRCATAEERRARDASKAHVRGAKQRKVRRGMGHLAHVLEETQTKQRRRHERARTNRSRKRTCGSVFVCGLRQNYTMESAGGTSAEEEGVGLAYWCGEVANRLSATFNVVKSVYDWRNSGCCTNKGTVSL